MKKQVILAVPSGGTMRTEMVSSLITSLYDLSDKGYNPNLIFQIGGYVAINRNNLVKEAIANKGTLIMFLDTDMIFPKDAIRQLMDQNKDIIAGNYNVRLGPLAKERSGTTVRFWDTKTKRAVVPLELQDETFKCYTAATGFMLINLKVFKKIAYPWFVSYQKDDGEHYTEDVDFCIKAQAAGIDVWCDPTISIGHIGQAVY